MSAPLCYTTLMRAMTCGRHQSLKRLRMLNLKPSLPPGTRFTGLVEEHTGAQDCSTGRGRVAKCARLARTGRQILVC